MNKASDFLYYFVRMWKFGEKLNLLERVVYSIFRIDLLQKSAFQTANYVELFRNTPSGLQITIV